MPAIELVGPHYKPRHLLALQEAGVGFQEAVAEEDCGDVATARRGGFWI